MLAIIVVAMSVLALGTAAGRLVIAEHQVRSAADLAALAGAASLATGADGCAAAARAAAVNGTRLEQCATERGGVITVRLRALAGISGWVARSAAAAGPDPAGPDPAARSGTAESTGQSAAHFRVGPVLAVLVKEGLFRGQKNAVTHW